MSQRAPTAPTTPLTGAGATSCGGSPSTGSNNKARVGVGGGEREGGCKQRAKYPFQRRPSEDPGVAAEGAGVPNNTAIKENMEETRGESLVSLRFNLCCRSTKGGGRRRKQGSGEEEAPASLLLLLPLCNNFM